MDLLSHERFHNLPRAVSASVIDNPYFLRREGLPNGAFQCPADRLFTVEYGNYYANAHIPHLVWMKTYRCFQKRDLIVNAHYRVSQRGRGHRKGRSQCDQSKLKSCHLSSWTSIHRIRRTMTELPGIQF
jgi:hypothetical protein